MDSSPVTSSISSVTQEFLETADPGNDLKKRSAAPLNNLNTGSSSTNERSRALAEVISEKFLPFDSETYIVTPFGAELARDVTVDEGV
jgi:hypothetical protein